MTTEPGAVSSSEAGALITVSTLRSLQAKHTPRLGGQAHTRLGLLERQHQVLRRAIELFLAQGKLSVTTDNVIQAVTYVIPQINNAPEPARVLSHPMGIWLCPTTAGPPHG